MVSCGECGKQLFDGPDPEPRLPCPACGSARRRYDEHIEDGMRLLDSCGFKLRAPGDGGFVAKGTSGYEVSKGTGRLVKKDSLFDKGADRRYEHVEDDETGEVLHHVDHKLTEHKGHGSAKLPSRKKRGR